MKTLTTHTLKTLLAKFGVGAKPRARVPRLYATPLVALPAVPLTAEHDTGANEMVWLGGNGGVGGGGVGGGSVGGKVGDGGGRVHNGGIGGDGIGVGKGGVGRQPAPRCEHKSEQLDQARSRASLGPN